MHNFDYTLNIHLLTAGRESCKQRAKALFRRSVGVKNKVFFVRRCSAGVQEEKQRCENCPFVNFINVGFPTQRCELHSSRSLSSMLVFCFFFGSLFTGTLSRVTVSQPLSNTLAQTQTHTVCSRRT